MPGRHAPSEVYTLQKSKRATGHGPHVEAETVQFGILGEHRSEALHRSLPSVIPVLLNLCSPGYSSSSSPQVHTTMKTFLVLAASLLASAVSAEKCVYATVAPELHSLAQPIAKCMTATDNSYNLVRPEVPPTPEQSAAICSKCKDFVDAVFALPPWPDCTLNLGGIDQTLTAYFDKMIGSCKTGGSDPVVATTAPPATTTTAPVVTTKAPAAPTTAPSSTATTPTTATTAPSTNATTEPTSTASTEAKASSGSQETEIKEAGSASGVSEPVVASNSSTSTTSAPTTSTPKSAATDGTPVHAALVSMLVVATVAALYI